VPLIFLSQDYAVSEAQIAYVEVPKVALLRTLAGFIAILWALEWAIKGRAFQDPFPSNSIQTLAGKLRPSNWLSAFNRWLKVHPTRWLLLAAGLFFGSTFLSTVLSGSFTNSIWGEIPGQDGYSAYTVASYGILFAVIATHLKKNAQLSRLLGAMVLMGVLVGLYGGLQHYHHDFFGVTEGSGGGSARVTIFMGNTIFAAAVLAMTVPLTLVAAAMNFRDENWGNFRPLAKLGQLGRDFIFTSLWASILSVQLLGLMFTFTRGAWGGAVLALVVFLILVVISLGFRMLLRTGLVLGLAAILSVAFLHWQGSVSVINTSEWMGFALAILGLAGTLSVLFVIKNYGTAILFITAVGAIITIVVLSVIAPSALSGRSDTGTTSASPISGLTAEQVTGRITSIKTDVLGGFVGGRGTHWKVSWKLIKNRPWFAFNDLSLSWLRPFIGYGPDLFRYTYLLESPPEDFGLLPLEPDHAHNFFIHQTVEQGFIGGLASIALFVSVFGVVGHLIIFRLTTGSPIFRLLLFGMMAIIIGRFLEMMVGVARISDLTVLWVIFGLFAATVSFDAGHQEETNSAANQSPKPKSLRRKRGAARSSANQSFGSALMFRLAIVAWLVGGIGVVTWQKSINSVRASIAEGQALEHFRNGNLESTLKELDKAIKLAPGVPNYYNNRAQLFLAYQLRPGLFTEPGCNQQTELPYLTCLGVKSLESNLESVRQQPFNFRTRIAAGNSAFNLQLNNSAMESYAIASNMVPNSWIMRNDLAEAQIELGLYNEALSELDWSLGITGDSPARTPPALYLKGKALKGLGQLDDALSTLKYSLSMSTYGEVHAMVTLDLIREINDELGVTLDTGYFDREIKNNPQDELAYYLRGIAHLTLGNTELAISDIETSISLGFTLAEARANLGYSRFRVGDSLGAGGEIYAALNSEPQNALFNAYQGEFQMSHKNYSQALQYLDKANTLNPELGLAYLVRAKIYLSLGLAETAKEVLETSAKLKLPTALDYVDRGNIYVFFGGYDLAFADLNEAIRINPNKAMFYDARAKAHANFSDFRAALEDFNTAIQLDPANSGYFINRGVVYELLGETERSLGDFEAAKAFGTVDVPPVDERNSFYFAVYTDSTSSSLDAKLVLKLQFEGQALKDIEYHSAILPNNPNYPASLQFIGQAQLELEMWQAAIQSFSNLIARAPTVPELYRARGNAYLALKRNNEAMSDFFQAVSLNNLDSVNFLAIGRGYAENGDYDLARVDFTAAIQLNPNSSDAYASRGYLSVQEGNYSLAFTDIDRAIEISPNNPDAYFKRAKAHIGLGETSLALNDLDQAINLAPINTDYLYRRGLLRYELAEFDTAIEDFSEAIALKEEFAYTDPRHAKPFVNRGKIYLETGKPDQALNDAKSSIELLENNFNSPGWDNRRPEVVLLLADAYQLLDDSNAKLGQ